MRSGAMGTGPSRRAIRAMRSSLCEGLHRGFYRSWFTCQSRDRRFAHHIIHSPAATSSASRPPRSTPPTATARSRPKQRARGSLRTDAHWQRLRVGDVVPEELKQHVRHHYAVRSQAAERVRALDPSFGESACGRRDAVKRNGPGRGYDRRAHRDRSLCRWQPL